MVVNNELDTNVRLPVQQRALDSWKRVLDSGVAIFTELGYEGFTIAEICRRASVAPRFVYDRVADKDALFMVVYLHALEPLRNADRDITDAERWRGLSPEQLVRAAVHEVGLRFMLNHDLLRNVALLSSSNKEVARYGAQDKAEFGQYFAQMLTPITPLVTHENANEAIEFCFDTVFSSWVARTAFGPEFSHQKASDHEFDRDMGSLAVRYLLATNAAD